MSDKEHDIPVKVVDRRWWANTEASAAEREGGSSLKPTYVEELEQQIVEKDKQIQEYLTKYRQASSEFEEMRLRLRREISKDIERTRREILSELLEVVDNLERALDAAKRSPSAEALLQGVEMVRRQFLSKLEGWASDQSTRATRASIPHSTKPSARCPHRRPTRMAWSSASSARAIGLATTCCGRRRSRWRRILRLRGSGFGLWRNTGTRRWSA